MNIPLIVGGGIRSAEQLNNAFQAGADIVVIGTAFEEDESFFNELKTVLNEKYLENRLKISERFGPNKSEATQKFTNEFNNGVIDYIYQNLF